MRSFRKFLATFAAQVGVGKYISHGHNISNLFVVEWITTSALAAGETLTLTLPAGVDISPAVAASDVTSYVPVLVSAWTPAAPRLKVVAADLLLTSFNPATNVAILTAAGGGVPTGSSIQLLCAMSTLRTP